MKLFTLLFIGFFLSFGVNAGALTSIKIDNKNYNLVIFDREEHAEPIEKFNRALLRRSRQEVINRCSFAIDMPVGVAKGNHSYGGFCSYMEGKETKKVMICADIMVGHLKMQPMEKYQYPEDGINALATFVAKNCTGG